MHLEIAPIVTEGYGALVPFAECGFACKVRLIHNGLISPDIFLDHGPSLRNLAGERGTLFVPNNQIQVVSSRTDADDKY